MFIWKMAGFVGVIGPPSSLSPTGTSANDFFNRARSKAALSASRADMASPVSRRTDSLGQDCGGESGERLTRGRNGTSWRGHRSTMADERRQLEAQADGDRGLE